jgi:hypothetical protein
MKLKVFLNFIEERENIRRQKEADQPQPWTKDKVLQRFRFTNIRRRDDRVSLWIQNHIIPLESDFDPMVFVQLLAFCRFVNWPPTISAAMHMVEDGGVLPWPKIGKMVDRRTASGEKAWTGAYMVRADQKSKWGKGVFISKIVVDREIKIHWPLIQAALRTRMRSQLHATLRGLYGWGDFMAGQVVDDMTWTDMFCGPVDEFTWAPRGPGSQRGLNRLLGQPIKQRWPTDEWCAALMDLRFQITKQLGVHYSNMTLMDVQNCLCEVDKYLRFKAGEGRPRSTYKPETAY